MTLFIYLYRWIVPCNEIGTPDSLYNEFPLEIIYVYNKTIRIRNTSDMYYGLGCVLALN